MGAEFEVYAPGHVRLFGDPWFPGDAVVVQAIDKGVLVHATPNHGSNSFEIEMPFFDVSVGIPIDGSHSPDKIGHLPDSFRAVVQELRREGAAWKEGALLHFQSELRFGAWGASGATVMAFARALVELANTESSRLVDPREIARLVARSQDRLKRRVFGPALRALGVPASELERPEDLEAPPPARTSESPPWTGDDVFEETHLLASALGGLQHLQFGATPFVLEIPSQLDGIVLIEDEISDERWHSAYDAVSRKRREVDQAINQILTRRPDLELGTASYEEVWNVLVDLAGGGADPAAASKRERLVFAALFGRDVLHAALRVLAEKPLDLPRLGELLNEHHARLRDDLDASTPRLEELRQAMDAAGAFGSIVQGEGAERLVVLAPGRTEAVRAQAAVLGASATVVRPSKGVIVRSIE